MGPILLCLLAGCNTAATNNRGEPALDHLLTKMNERLALMESVAKYKWTTAKPIADPDREAVLLSAMEEKAKASQFSPKDARWFFAAQIEAAKALQENHHLRWKQDEQTVPKEAADLAELRRRIDAVNDELLAALIEYRKHPVDRALVRRKASDLIVGEGINERVRSLAIQPLLSDQ